MLSELSRLVSRMTLLAAMLALGVPLAAQDTTQTLPPPPANGPRAQGPDDNGITPLPTPAPGQVRPAPTLPTPGPTRGPTTPLLPNQPDAPAEPRVERPAPPPPTVTRTPEPRAVPDRPTTAASGAPAIEPAIEPPLATARPADDTAIPDSTVTSPDVALATGEREPALPTGSADAATGSSWRDGWPYALGALALFGALWFWRRARARTASGTDPVAHDPVPASPHADRGDRDGVAASLPAEVDRPTQPSVEPQRPEPPLAAPVAPSPSPAPAPTPPVAPALSDILVTTAAPVTAARTEARARLTATLVVTDLRTTAQELVTHVELHIVNAGDAPAEGALVRVLLAQAQSGQEALFDGFFEGAGGSTWQEIDRIDAGQSAVVAGELSLNLDRVTPLSVQGRPLLVPVLGVDVTYHWPDDVEAFGQASAVHVLGVEPGPGGGRLLPVHLDRGARRWHPAGARATALTRQM